MGIWASHCLCLLSHVAKNRDEYQTELGLSEVCLIPRKTLRSILEDARTSRDSSYLAGIARKYGYSYRIVDKPGKIIDVESRGPFPIHKA